MSPRYQYSGYKKSRLKLKTLLVRHCSRAQTQLGVAAVYLSSSGEAHPNPMPDGPVASLVASTLNTVADTCGFCLVTLEAIHMNELVWFARGR